MLTPHTAMIIIENRVWSSLQHHTIQRTAVTDAGGDLGKSAKCQMCSIAMLRQLTVASELPTIQPEAPFQSRTTAFPMICDGCTCSQTHESMAGMKSIRLGFILPAVMTAAFLSVKFM